MITDTCSCSYKKEFTQAESQVQMDTANGTELQTYSCVPGGAIRWALLCSNSPWCSTSHITVGGCSPSLPPRSAWIPFHTSAECGGSLGGVAPSCCCDAQWATVNMQQQRPPKQTFRNPVHFVFRGEVSPRRNAHIFFTSSAEICSEQWFTSSLPFTVIFLIVLASNQHMAGRKGDQRDRLFVQCVVCNNCQCATPSCYIGGHRAAHTELYLMLKAVSPRTIGTVLLVFNGQRSPNTFFSWVV